jgi:hypothetical protein
MAIATSVLLTLARVNGESSTGDVPGSHTLYRPVGIWMLLGHHAPPEFLVRVLWVLAWAATLAMLVGAATRISTAVSFVAAVALAALVFASGQTWSHQYNVVFVAQLAFLGAHAGDVWSVDALVRRWRGLPAIDRVHAYQWSLRLVQLAVAVMFASAFFHKWMHGHGTLRWALSDNLRNQLLVRFDLADLARPPVADWIVDDPWRYRTAAMLNLITQATPIIACFMIRRPVVRALCGIAFVIETLALGFVVDLWNLHWLPLYAVFVDWDALLARITRRTSPDPEPPPMWQPPRATRIFIIAFVVYDVITAFVPGGLDQRLNTFPFSGFPMFANIRSKAPYLDHHAYDLVAAQFLVTSDPPIDLATQRWFDHTNRTLHLVTDPDELHKRLAAVLAQAQRRYPMYKITKLRLYASVFEAPAYPARAHFESHPIAVMAELSADGTYRTLLGRLDDRRVELRPRGIDTSGATLAYYRDASPDRINLPASRQGDAFMLPTTLEGDPTYVVALTTDHFAWMIASTDHP